MQIKILYFALRRSGVIEIAGFRINCKRILTTLAVDKRTYSFWLIPGFIALVHFIYVEVTKCQELPVGAKIQDVKFMMEEWADLNATRVDNRSHIHCRLPYTIIILDRIINIG